MELLEKHAESQIEMVMMVITDDLGGCMKQLKIQKRIEFKLRMLATPELEEKIKNNKYFTKKVEELNAKVEKAQSLSDKSRFSIDCYSK